MGLIHIPVTLRSFERIDAAFEARFLVDTGATDSMAPPSELRRIGIVPVGRMAYEPADGSAQEYAFGLARIEFMGDVTAGRVLFGPDDVEPLLGVAALESIGITIDPVTQTLRRRPSIPLRIVGTIRRNPGRVRQGPNALASNVPNRHPLKPLSALDHV